MSRTAIAKDLVVAQARALKMPGLLRVYEALARQAREEHWGYEDYLHEVLSAEQTSRSDSAVRQRLREARFPEMKTLDTFDFASTDSSVSPAQIAELARGEWIKRADNAIFAGPVGTGKTHLAIAIGVEAAKQRRRVLFVRAADVVRSLLKARDARELGRLQRRLYQVDLLVLDELGFVPFDRAGGELFFNIQLTLDALAMALRARAPGQGLLHHSDRGSQYASADYQAALSAAGITCRVSRKGNCYDNAVAESFFATLKTELVHDADWATRADARSAIFEYLEVFYNRRRRHSSIGYVSPEQFELRYEEEKTAA